MSEMRNEDRKAMMAGAFDNALASMKTVFAGIAGQEKQLAELKQAVPEGILLAARAHVYRLFGLVDGKGAFVAADLPPVHDVMRRFTDFLPDARRHYEEAAGSKDTRFLPVDENLRIARNDNDPELRQYREEFRQDWAGNMLGLVRQYVYDQFKLTQGRHELDTDEFLKLYESAFAFYYILEDEMQYVMSLARQTGAHGQDENPPSRQ